MEITREDIVRFIKKASEEMDANKDYLIELDAASGDGDLGMTMSKGFQAGAEAGEAFGEDDLGKMIFKIGSAIAAKVPSTMGTLMGSGFVEAGKALKGKKSLGAEDFVSFCQAYYHGVQKRGKASPGDRTVLDALKPAADAAAEAAAAGTDDPKELARIAYEAALSGVEATKSMAPVHGKAYVHREKLAGVPDQGAIVGSLLYKAWAETF